MIFFYFVLASDLIKNLCIGVVSCELPLSITHRWLFTDDCCGDVYSLQIFITPPKNYSLPAARAGSSHTSPKGGTPAPRNQQCSPEQGTRCLCRALHGGDRVLPARKGWSCHCHNGSVSDCIETGLYGCLNWHWVQPFSGMVMEIQNLVVGWQNNPEVPHLGRWYISE